MCSASPLIDVSIGFEPPFCPKCSGQGFWFNAAAGAPPEIVTCDCQRAKAKAAALAKLVDAIPPRFRSCTRETWGRGKRWPLSAEADAWPAAVGADPWAIVLIGPPGVGKTHVATALYRRLLEDSGEQGRPAIRRPLWMSQDELVAAAIAEIRGERHGSITRWLADTDLLLLDDVGRTRATEHSIELVRSAVYLRHLYQRPTILTANATRLEDFDAFDPALTSRLREGTLVFFLDGSDQRRVA